MSDLIKDIVSEWSMKLYNGTPDIHDSGHLLILHDILNKRKLPEEAVSMIIDGLRQLNEFPDTMTNQGDTGVPTSTMDYGKTHTKSLTYSTSSTSVGAMDFIDPLQPQDTYQKLNPEDDDDPYADDDDEVDEVAEFKFDPDQMKVVEIGNMIPLMELDEVLSGEKFKCFMTEEVYYETKNGGLIREVDIVKKKATGNVYDVQKFNPDRGQALVKKDASEKDIAKAEKGEPIDQKAPEPEPEVKSTYDFKPQKIMKGLIHTKASKAFSDTTKESFESQGIKVDTLNFYGNKLDKQNKDTFTKGALGILSTIGKNIESADERTKQYVEPMLNSFNSILNDASLDANYKLKKLNKELPSIYLEAFNKSGGNKSFIKDFGEVATYLTMLSNGREVYMPTQGAFPLADLIEIKRDDEGAVISIEKISIKSKLENSVEGAASSAAEIATLLSYADSENAEKYKSMAVLHTNSVESVDVNYLSEQDKQSVELIKSIDTATSLEDADDKLKQLGMSDKDIKLVHKKFKRYYDKFLKRKRIRKRNFDEYAVAYKELSYRLWSGNRTIQVMNEADIELPLEYVTVSITYKPDPDGKVLIQDKGKIKTSSFEIHDKGQYNAPVFEGDPPKVVSQKYKKSNLAARPKH